jgi:hypothetical protein
MFEYLPYSDTADQYSALPHIRITIAARFNAGWLLYPSAATKK